MKTTIEFDLPQEKDLMNHHLKSVDYYLSLWDIANKVFRPARKHGYHGRDKLQKLLEEFPQGSEIVGELEEMFFEILQDRDISLD